MRIAEANAEENKNADDGNYILGEAGNDLAKAAAETGGEDAFDIIKR